MKRMDEVKCHRRFPVRSALWAIVSVHTLFGCSDLGVESSGWRTSTPEAQGLDGEVLSQLAVRIDAGDFGEIHSLLVARHGFLVLERYFRGSQRGDLHPIFSVTKSVTSVLIGIAFEKQLLDSLGTPVLSYFPEYISLPHMDERKRAITLEHLLTMTAGFEWDEASVPYGASGNPTTDLFNSPDWLQFMLARPMSDPPGTRFVYNSGCTMLLSGILHNRTGVSTQRFAESVLFRPIGVTSYGWETGPNGLSNTGWGLRMRPVDMARFGQLVLQEGRWEETQVVSPLWIRRSAIPRQARPSGLNYGYQWWMMPLEMEGRSPQPNDALLAWGWGGQFVIVIPRLNIVLVTTGGNYTGPDDQAISFVREYIVKSVKE